jgi:hypothetical protein
LITPAQASHLKQLIHEHAFARAQSTAAAMGVTHRGIEQKVAAATNNLNNYIKDITHGPS